MTNENNFHLQGALSYMTEYFRQFDIQHPDWGEEQHIAYAVKYVHPDHLMQMLNKDFQARKQGIDNIAMFICGTQGTGKSLSAMYFANKLSELWETKFKFENLGFFDAETSESLDKAQEGETIWQDEHDSKQIGALSVYLKERLIDFVLRGRRKKINFIFCSPSEQDKGQFITLETKNTRKDPITGKPICVEALVKTPWYFDANQRITRGIIFIPVQNLNDLEEYDKRKMESLEKLKKQYGSNFDYIGTKAKEIFELLKKDLIIKNKKTFEYEPKKGNDFKAICLLGKEEIKGIGSSGTHEARALMLATIKNYTIEYCDKLNSQEFDNKTNQQDLQLVPNEGKLNE